MADRDDVLEDGAIDRRAASGMSDGAEDGAVGASPADAGAEGQPQEPQAGSSVEQQLAEALERAESHYRNWQRSAADFANYKRRTEQEKSETARIYNAALVINLLPVYDDLERAVAGVDAQLAGLNWVQGIVAIQRKFRNLLEAMGVSEIEAGGAHFDPSLHEAVAKQPGEEGKVLHVVQKGYRLGEKVIRPAAVIVGEGS